MNQQGDLEVVGLFNAGITIVFVYAGMVFSVMDQDFYPRLRHFGFQKNEESVKERNLCVNCQLEMNVLLLGPIVAAIILGLPLIIPILYNAQFMGMLQMTQLAAIAMLFKAVYLPIEYLPLSRETPDFSHSGKFCVILLIICEIAGYQLDGLRGVGGYCRGLCHRDHCRLDFQQSRLWLSFICSWFQILYLSASDSALDVVPGFHDQLS
ncbi:MAG: hypothetical protein EP152_04800 [Prevotella copri]|nr:hypothetical protein [Segatella copri]